MVLQLLHEEIIGIPRLHQIDFNTNNPVQFHSEFDLQKGGIPGWVMAPYALSVINMIDVTSEHYIIRPRRNGRYKLVLLYKARCDVCYFVRPRRDGHYKWTFPHTA